MGLACNLNYNSVATILSISASTSVSCSSLSRRLCCKASSFVASFPSSPSPACALAPSTRTEKLTTRAEVPEHRQGLSLLPTSQVTLHELLRSARISPILVSGDENVLITGIQHDSRLVKPGNVFVCCRGFSTDGHVHAAHAIERGAVAIVSTKSTPTTEIPIAFVQVEDTNSILSALSSAFYGHPSEKLTVVGITGTNGKTTTSYLVKSIFEAMNMKTGLLGTIAHDINDGSKIVASNTTPDALSLQCLMAAMRPHGLS
ncbi:hypothetical protein GOP47_0007684 [Adiantum capillus-veneris]|uniref:Uncharacterized protein n=1 Tax=Adiantum capillus-veneris TaxID=13818 RepID=A0A9D4ZM71_ADICA|nr:hypothetical protein GOP47_0007684 [Adiantum capillus-veneris]